MGFPWGAVIGGFGSALGGMFGARGMVQAANIGAMAQKDQLEIGAMMQREQQKGIIGGGIDARISPLIYSPLLMEQERRGFEYMTDVGRGKQRSQDFKDKQAELAFRGLPAFGAMKRSQMQRAFDKARGMSAFDPQARMFGSIYVPRFDA